MMDADIQILAGDWRALDGEVKAIVRRAVEALRDLPARPSSAGTAAPGREVSIVLSDDAQVQALNRAHRGKDQPTNVLAFPAPEAAIAPAGAAPVFLGDVILAFETVRDEAKAQNKPFADHMCHLIVHGTLHLLGYDHQTSRDAARMEAEETAILGRLGIPDPYLTEEAEEARTAPDG